MKKLLPGLLAFTIFFILFASPKLSFAQQDTAPVTIDSALPQEGSWIRDPEVTKVGKNAARSGMLLDWTLQEYHWASMSAESTKPLAEFWMVIQRIVYALFLFVIIVTSFILIITRGKSLSARRFLPRFFLVILLVTFSFSLVKFVYQITDIFQGFFLKNPQGAIISSKDLLYVGFDYKDFVGLRVFGQNYDESAMISLLLVKLTAFTYYVMSILLIIRKIILWFFIVISPVFPLLLLFYPLRNTAKIWIGEFFRWVLYAPLFAIFLSGLVKMWQSSLPLPFNYFGENIRENIIYPTAINILLGGPQRLVTIDNSVNLPNTFALYLVALLMLWVVIIMPFILLQIFLDYMYAFNFKEAPVFKQMMGIVNNRLSPPPPPPPVIPVGPGQPAGLARNLPFGRRFAIPTSQGVAGQARQIPTTTTINQQEIVARPYVTNTSNQAQVLRLTNLSLPTMRDIARFERERLSKDTLHQREVQRTQQVLRNIANPMTVTNATERERYIQIREKLVQESKNGNPVATTILQAANTYTTSVTQQSSILSSTEQLIQQLSRPERITNTIEREKIIQLKEQIIHASKENNTLATSLLRITSSVESSKEQQLQRTLEKVVHPQSLQSPIEKEKYQALRERIIKASRSGNQLASLVLSSLESRSSSEQVKAVQEQLLKAESSGNPLATEILKTVQESSVELSKQQIEKIQTELQEAQKRGDPLAGVLLNMLSQKTSQKAEAPLSATAKVKTGTFPVVNRVQQVSLDDYEAVKKLWRENYQNLDVPSGLQGVKARKEWIEGDITDIQQTISLLTSQNPQDVEEGMKKVSDILPFLLIGGFSQTEIIAYLKAKMEAGKSIIEELEKTMTEEETLVEASQSSAQSQQQMHMAVEREIRTPVNTATVSTKTDTVVSPINNSSVATTQYISHNTVKSDQMTSFTNVLKLANLSLPTMRDIVRYERALLSRDASKRTEVERFKTTLSSLAHPESLSSKDEKERIAALKDALEKESKQGNALASSILAAIVSIGGQTLSVKDTPLIIDVLRTVIDPSVVTDASQKDVFLRARNMLIQAKQHADPLALQVLKTVDTVSQKESEATALFLKKLSIPETISSVNERTQLTKLKERLEQERSNGNQLAEFILSYAKEETNTVDANKVRVHLLELSQKGDALATYILSSHIFLPQETQKQIITVYQQLIQEKQKGNTLAALLLRLFSQKKQQVTGGVPLHTLPRQNRIQQVSLDDYEAVKKMWRENYLSSDLSGTAVEERTSWIKKDIEDVAETINLLSSSDSAVVEDGMNKVGDLLPFLLIGGFSKEEIIAYLKAKMEAGKSVIEELEKDQQEDQKVERQKTISQKKENVMQMEQPVPDNRASSVQMTRNTYKQEISNQSRVQNQTINSSLSQPNLRPILQQISLPVVKLTDLVRMSTDRKLSADKERIFSVLTKLAHPEKVSDRIEKEKYMQLRSLLLSQSREGDEYATSLLSASDLLEKSDSKNLDAAVDSLSVLRDIAFPELGNHENQSELQSLHLQIQQELERGNPLAREAMTIASDYKNDQINQLQNLIVKIHNPASSSSDSEKKEIMSLRDHLETAQSLGNVFAEKILSFGEHQPTKEEIENLFASLLEKQRTDRLASILLTSYITLPEKVLSSATTFIQKLQSQKDNTVADILKKLLRKQQETRRRQRFPVRLPRQNRLQQVSTDDYESVKRMWYEAYLHGEVPPTAQGQIQTREEWITSDSEQLDNILNLFVSDDPENNAKAMDQVTDILPFLLIGGFSKGEMIGYLKAKREAAAMALTVLNEQKNAQELVEVPSQNPKIQQPEKSMQQSESEIHDQ